MAKAGGGLASHFFFRGSLIYAFISTISPLHKCKWNLIGLPSKLNPKKELKSRDVFKFCLWGGGLEGIPLWMRLFVLHKKLLQFFQTKDYKIQKILEDINFILHLFNLSDILEVMNNCNCYLQGPRSNIVDFAINWLHQGWAKCGSQAACSFLTPQTWLFSCLWETPRTFFVLQLHLHPHFQLLCGLLFDSLVTTLRLFYFSASGFCNENFAYP